VISVVKYVVKHGIILRRRPRLGKIVRSPAFIAASGQVTEWIDGQFDQVELAAPWLHRVGQDIHHYCLTATRSRGVLRGGILTATPSRLVTTVYRARGDLTERVAALEEALARQGWGAFSLSPVTVYRRPSPLRPPPAGSPMAVLPPPVRASWQPEGGREGAARMIRDSGGRDLFRGHLAMDIGWAGRKDPPGPVTALASAGPGGGQITPFYQPVEYRSADIPALIGQIRSGGESVIAIRIMVRYTVK
jgi:hypothetical protein